MSFEELRDKYWRNTIYAQKIYNPDSKAYFYSVVEQESIFPQYLDDTCVEYQKLYYQMDAFIQSNEITPTGTLIDVEYHPINSGPWFPSEEQIQNALSCNWMTEHLKGILNTWNNMSFTGYNKNTNKPLTTSLAKAWKPPSNGQNGWIITRNSIYIWEPSDDQ